MRKFAIRATCPGKSFCLSCLGGLVLSLPVYGQQVCAQPDQACVQTLLERIEQLETRVNTLESQLQAPPSPRLAQTSPAEPSQPVADPVGPAAPPAVVRAAQQNPGPTPPQPSVPTETQQAQADAMMADRMDLSRTLMRIRGFGDVSLHGDNGHGDTTSFSLGQLDLFVTSDLSDKFRFLSEIVFEAGADDFYGHISGPENQFSVDIERYLLQYSYNDYFSLAAGRGHTSIGYYNTAYHHSTWLQTTTGRPYLFAFEDEGGILPIHNVGVTAFGRLLPGPLGLHYVAEVGNGRESRTPLTTEPVQNETSDLNGKAFNFAVFSKPSSIPGLQAGFSIYHDTLAPQGLPKVGEDILSAHAVFIRPQFEWLNEALLDRHSIAGTSQTFNTPGFYTQISRQFGSYRPYFRYQYVNVPSHEPIFPDVGLQAGPSVGLRYDASDFVALKLQYDHTTLRAQPGVDGLTAQVGFTF